MTPQSNFMVLAPVAAGRVDALRQLLGSMNVRPGVVDPHNALVPFGEFNQLHFARIVVLEDQTLNDITVYGVPRVEYPIHLAFLADFDGPADAFVNEFVMRAGRGLREIFSYCEGFTSSTDLRHWMKAHEHRPATAYVNWIGRTVRQVGEEAALHEALANYTRDHAAELQAKTPGEVRLVLQRFARSELEEGRLTLTPEAGTPIVWGIGNLLHLILVPLLLLLLLPLLLLYAPFFAFQLRRRERSDREIAPRIDPVNAHNLATLEDHDVCNQFSAFGSLKPGRFRRWTLSFLLWVINYTARHIYNRGRLARVNTIHFARWVFIDDKKRLFLASNYDGSLDSYMDDFINKVAFGLNVVFSNGIGYPTTNWLLLDGAKDELKFKYYIRRHEAATEVWYNAHPGLTALDRERNTMIRKGLEQTAPMSDVEVRQWLQLL